MSRLASLAAALAGPLVLGACAVTPPSGPNVWVLPGEGKDLARFEQDDTACRNYAMQQIGLGPSQQRPVSGSSAELQERYDLAYLQCMAAYGNKVPTTATGEPYLITPYAYSGAYPGWYDYPYYGYYYGPLFGAGVSLGFFGHHHFGHFHHAGGFHHGGHGGGHGGHGGGHR